MHIPLWLCQTGCSSFEGQLLCAGLLIHIKDPLFKLFERNWLWLLWNSWGVFYNLLGWQTEAEVILSVRKVMPNLGTLASWGGNRNRLLSLVVSLAQTFPLEMLSSWFQNGWFWSLLKHSKFLHGQGFSEILHCSHMTSIYQCCQRSWLWTDCSPKAFHKPLVPAFLLYFSALDWNSNLNQAWIASPSHLAFLICHKLIVCQ